MNTKTKRAVLILSGLGVLLLGGVVMAASDGKKKEKKPGDAPGTDADDVVVIPPGASGIPDGSAPPIIVLPPKELPSKSPPFIPTTPPTDEEQDSASYKPAKYEVTVGPAVIEPATPPANVFPMPPKTSEAQKVADSVLKDLGPKAIPIAIAETKPAMDPRGTIALAHLMLGRETLPNWKEDLKIEIKGWQSKVGLKPDGLYGVISAAKMAEEVGILPLIRFWSKAYSSKSDGLKDYQNQILNVGAKLQQFLPGSKAHILALGESVKRESGLTFGTNPPPTETMIQVQKINDNLAAQAQAEGKKEMNA